MWALRAFLLVFAVAATVLVAWLVLSEGRPASRGEGRSRGAVPLELPPKAPEERGAGGQEPPPGPRRQGFPLAGYVRDPGGAPVAGAVVRAAFKGTFVDDRTDAQGAYAVEVTSPICTFDVWADGYLPLVGTVGGRSNGELDLVFEGEGPWRKDFTLTPAASLAGTVYDDGGQPVKGARVYVIPADYALLDRETVGNAVTSDAAGAFSFPGLPAGVTDLGVRVAGFLPLLVKDVAIPERGTVQQDLRVVRGRDVLVKVINDPADDIELLTRVGRGDPNMPPPQVITRVIASDSRLRKVLLPPGGVDVLADALVGRAFAGLPVVLARREEGRYRLTGVGPGPADIAARPDLLGSTIIEPGLGEKLDTVEPEVTLTLVPGIRIRVNVRDAITAEVLEPAVTRQTVGVNGDLPVEHLEGNSYRVPYDDRRHALVFNLDGYEEARLDLPDLRTFDRGTDVSFDVAMRRTAQGETGGFFLVFEPPLDGRLALVGRDASGAQCWVKHIESPDRQGRWSVDDVPVGVYAVSILATGKVPALLAQVAVARGIKDTHRVMLTEGGGLSLRVTDMEGQLLDKVHLLLKDQAGNPIDVHVLSHVSEGSAFLSVNYLPSAATAKADSGLAAGFYEIAVYREGFEVGKKGFEVVGTDVAEVEIALQRAAK